MVQIGSLMFDQTVLLITGAAAFLAIVIGVIVFLVEEGGGGFCYSPGMYNHASNYSAGSSQSAGGTVSQSGILSTVLYHGTPERQGAMDIVTHGFVIGPGNFNGTGLYLADLQTAKQYAKGAGVIVEVLLRVPYHQVGDYQSVVRSAHFSKWRFAYGGKSVGDDITKYAESVLKKRFLKVNQKFYVALAERTFGNERVIFEGIRVLGVLDSFGNPL